MKPRPTRHNRQPGLRQEACPGATGALPARSARNAVPAGRHVDVLHDVKPLDRIGFERLLSAIERRQIFTQEILEELDVQMDRLTTMVGKGTT